MFTNQYYQLDQLYLMYYTITSKTFIGGYSFICAMDFSFLSLKTK